MFMKKMILWTLTEDSMNELVTSLSNLESLSLKGQWMPLNLICHCLRQASPFKHINHGTNVDDSLFVKLQNRSGNCSVLKIIAHYTKVIIHLFNRSSDNCRFKFLSSEKNFFGSENCCHYDNSFSWFFFFFFGRHFSD